MPNPKNQLELSKNRVIELLDTNNSASSKTSDKLLSILEAGEGSFLTRDTVDQFLHNYLDNTMTIALAETNLGYSWSKLRQHLSIKDKIAYITANIYAHNTLMDISHVPPIVSIVNIDDTMLRTELEQLIRNIEENLLNNRDFTESRILRNSAINRFECKLTTPERIELNGIAIQLKQVCSDNQIGVLANSTDFTNESDAQKIMKLYEVLGQLSEMGINPPENIVKGFEKFDEKLKPLKDLDEHFKHMTKTLNMIHMSAQRTYHSMVTPNQRNKVEKIMDTLGEREGVNKALLEYNKIENFQTNNEHTFIQDLLTNITRNSKYEETLLTEGVSKAQFNERFISLSTFIVTEQCKLGFEAQKETTFGTRTKAFEADTQSRRGMVRRRLFQIADRMNGNDFDTTADSDIAHSYFEKFKDLFFAKEEDNYQTGASNLLQYNRMAKITAAIIRDRVPALANGRRLRVGSFSRRIFKLIENAIKGTNRGLFNRIRRERHHADDATIVAMIVMAQNQATNQMFYQDKNQFKERERRYGKIFRRIRFAEYGREAVRDAIAPTANKALQLIEIGVKQGLKAASGTAKLTNTVASKTIRGITRATGGLTGKYNSMIEKKGKNGKSYARRKTPLYLPYLITKPIQQGSDLLNRGATWTDGNLNNEISKIDNKVSEGYETALKVVGEATGEETKYLFKGLTYATEQTTSLLGKTISAGGKAMHDAYTAGQQRSILGAFYNAASEQKGLEDLMQSSELADVLNLKEDGPTIFDKDGRFLTVDKIEADKVKEAGKALSNKIKKQLEDLQKGIDDKRESLYRNIQDSLRLNNGNDGILNDSLQRLESRSGDIMHVRTELERLIPLLKDPALNTAAIRGVTSGLNTDIVGAGGLMVQAQTRINTINNIPPGNPDSRLIQQTIINTSNMGIITEDANIRANQANDPISRAARSAAENTRANHINNKNNATQQIKNLYQELIDLQNRISWLQKISSTCTTIHANPADEDTLKSLTNSLDLTLYKPTVTQPITLPINNNPLAATG